MDFKEFGPGERHLVVSSTWQVLKSTVLEESREGVQLRDDDPGALPPAVRAQRAVGDCQGRS